MPLNFFKFKFLILALLSSFLLYNCFGVDLENLDPSEFIDPSQITPTSPPGSSPFQSTVIPAFANAGCSNSGCHGAGSVQGASSNPPGLNFEIGDGAPGGSQEDTPEFLHNYLLGVEGDTVYVDSNNASSSFILTYPQAGTNHGGGNAWGGTSNSDYQAVLSWIQSGAPF